MAIGIGIGVPFRVNFSWQSYWASRSLFFLDGTIITVGADKYFKDKSSAARNFLITGYDFATDWTSGFPFKSASTISAPVGDATLIAADTGLFWYDAGGTPRAIPVVSLFQNIDYLNIIWCRHIAQVLDGDGVETYEPRVMDVFMVDGTLSASDLIKANTYFNPSSESTYWLNLTGGNDANNATTRALAKLKWGAIETGLASGTVNVLTGVDLSAWTPAKAIDRYGKGYVSCPRCASGNSDNARTFEHIIFDAANAANWFDCGTGAIFSNITLRKCLFKNALNTGTGIGKYAAKTSDNIKLDSVVINQGVISRMVSCGVTEIKNSLLKGAPTGFYLNAEKYVTISNCKINVTINGTLFLFTLNAGGAIIGCKITNASSGSILLDSNATATQTKFNHNTVRQGDITYAVGKYIHLKGANSEACDNDIVLTGTSVAGTDNASQIIYVFGSTTPTVERNTIDFASANFTRCIEVFSNGVDCGAAKINSQRILCRAAVNCMVLSLDGEKTAAEHHLFDDFEMNDNVIYMPDYYGLGYGTAHSIMAHGNNGQLRRNYVNGGAIGIIMKSQGAVVVADMSGNKIINCKRGLYVKGTSGMEMYNNLVDFTTGMINGIYVEKNIAWVSESTNPHDNILIYRGDGTDYAGLICLDSADNLVGFTSDYNTLYTTQAFVVKVGATTYTFAEWQALGYDLHSTLLTEAPVFDESEL